MDRLEQREEEHTAWYLFAVAPWSLLLSCTGQAPEPVSYADSGTDSVASWCGDAVVSDSEACDDGNAVGGDGCTPVCTEELGQLEVEPNNEPSEAEVWVGPTFHGAVAGEDVDCVQVDIEACSSISASASCPVPMALSLVSPSGAVVATGSPSDESCAHLDPEIASGAQFLEPGAWAVCASPLVDQDVPYYALTVDVIDDGSYPIPDDLDGDGVPARCDLDDDGDGVADEDDNCPETPNGPDMAPLAPDDDGFLRTWLAAGPYTGTTSPDTCLPSDDSLVAEDDAAALPELGGEAGELVWTALFSDGARLQFLTDYGDVSAPREVYVAVYVYSEAERDAVLALGPDDGARAWLNGEVVLDVSGCQGTNVDQFSADVTLPAGWSPLLIKVRDQGGGWGLYARFLDTGGEPITDLELSLSPDGTWLSDQVDSDGDGQGDVCDDTP